MRIWAAGMADWFVRLRRYEAAGIGQATMQTEAGAVMTRNVVTAGPDDPAATIAKILSKNGISAVPVCDPTGRLLGMISEGDLLRPFGSKHNLKRDWWLGLLADGMSLAPEFLDYVREDHHPAKDLMTKDVITIKETTPLAEAADLMMEHKVKRLPVVRGGRIVGILSRADLVRAFFEQSVGLAGSP